MVDLPGILWYHTEKRKGDLCMINSTVVTAARMKAIEQAADAAGLSYLTMMENAGRAAWEALVRRFPAPGHLLVVTGKGNNGGDGFVMARLAAQAGWQVTVWLAEGEPKTPDAITNRELLRKLPVTVQGAETRPDPQGWDAVVDAVYGTGFHGGLRPAGRAACDLLRQCRATGAFLLAVDLPSGVSADTGEAADGAVQADLTVAFDSRKPAHETPEAAAFCGEVLLADIGIPEACHQV